VVGRTLGITALGLYGRAYGLMSTTVKITGGIFDKVLFSALAKIQSDQRRLRKAFAESQTAVVFSILPISAVLICLAPETIYLMLGSQWMEVVPAFQILAAGLLLQVGHRVALAVTRGTGAVYRMAGIQFCYAVAVIVGALVGARWGLRGVAAGVLFAMFVAYTVAARVALDIVQMGWLDFLKMHRTGLVAACSVFVVTWGAAMGMRWYDAPAVAVFAISLLAGGSVWLLFARRVLPGLLGEEATGQIRFYVGGRRYRRDRNRAVGAPQ
jgi:PST family polysaccharide transporter